MTETTLPQIPVTLTHHDAFVAVEWQWLDATYRREYHWPTQEGRVDDHRANTITAATDFADHLRSLNRMPSGPATFRLDEADLIERERAAELRRTLLEVYLTNLASGENGAVKAAAEELHIPRDRMNDDEKLIRQFLRCQQLHGGLRDAMAELNAFHQSLTEDEQADLFTRPSLKQKHQRLKQGVEACRDARRGMLDVRRNRPDWFEPGPIGEANLIVDVDATVPA